MIRKWWTSVLSSLKKKPLNFNRSSTVRCGEREDKKKERKKNVKTIVIKCTIGNQKNVVKDKKEVCKW